MVLHLTESDVRELATMDLALGAVEEAFRALGNGEAENVPRRRLMPSIGGAPPQSTLQLMAAALPAANAMGYKAYSTSPGGARFMVMLHAADSGALLALIEADWLGRYRTGAASGVATRYLARPESRVVGMYGTGGQAPTQLLAVCMVLPALERIRVYSRSAERRAAFPDAFAAFAPHVPVAVEPVDRPEAAADGADVIVTITNAREPVLHGSWLSTGTHVNAAGINRINAAEIDAEVVRRAALIAVDALDQARIEAGDLAAAAQAGAFAWDDAVELGAIVAGKARGRRGSDEVTLFESQGLAVEDVALGAALYRLAKERGVGRELPLWAAPA